MEETKQELRVLIKTVTKTRSSDSLGHIWVTQRIEEVKPACLWLLKRDNGWEAQAFTVRSREEAGEG